MPGKILLGLLAAGGGSLALMRICLRAGPTTRTLCWLVSTPLIYCYRLERLMVASTMIKNVRTLTHDDRFVVLLLGLVHALILGLLQLIHLAGVLPHHLGGEGD